MWACHAWLNRSCGIVPFMYLCAQEFPAYYLLLHQCTRGRTFTVGAPRQLRSALWLTCSNICITWRACMLSCLDSGVWL
jgi:hypothetical protein